MMEVMVALALIGIGVSTTIAALTKFNEFASTSRNATGAYTVAMNQIDAIQAATPVDPTDLILSPTIPETLAKLVGTPSPLVDPSTFVGTLSKPIYQEDSIPSTAVTGTVTTTITDVSPTPGVAPFLYNATVTVTYTYLGRDHSFSMSTLRTSDQ